MAKEIAKLLRTEMAADVTALPMLAKLLQQYGRKGDKMLAHITPEEAQRLEEEGGSGTINPHTGLPEYYDGEFDTSQEMGSFTPEAAAEQFPDLYPGGQPPGADQNTTFFPPDASAPGFPRDAEYTPSGTSFAARSAPAATQAITRPFLPGAETQLDPATAPGMQYQTPAEISAAAAAAPKEEKGFFEGMSPQEKRNLALRTALGVGSGLIAGYSGRQAQKQAQQAKQEIANIGKPYQETGKQLQEQALRGELTPAGQQQVQAAQAQLAQGAERRGGVGAQQAATQIAAFRQSLLDTQYNYGLKIAQIGDSYAANAIRTGLTQDAGVSSSMKAYTAALAAMYGMQPNVQG
jgi:hypothetical protein